MNTKLRQIFDEALDEVVAELPQQVRDLLNVVPLVIEDYPSREVLQKTGVRHRSHLCGLYTGIPLIHRSIEHSGIPSDVIHIYREGILTAAARGNHQVNLAELHEQIRKTILHEIGHHHGLTEKDLHDLGYD